MVTMAEFGLLPAQIGDPRELGIQIQRQLLDVSGHHLRAVEL
jgi:hypothetical protein